MLKKLVDAAFEKFCETDTPELQQLCTEKAQKVLSMTVISEDVLAKTSLNPETIFAELFQDVGSAYELVAFEAGFKACSECIKLLMGLEAEADPIEE